VWVCRPPEHHAHATGTENEGGPPPFGHRLLADTGNRLGNPTERPVVQDEGLAFQFLGRFGRLHMDRRRVMIVLVRFRGGSGRDGGGFSH
jgi:hypothetical protein